MTELTEEIIDVMKRIKDAIKDSPFTINRFSVENTYNDGLMITLDIRRYKEE